jgi:hypothetical protein
MSANLSVSAQIPYAPAISGEVRQESRFDGTAIDCDD